MNKSSKQKTMWINRREGLFERCRVNRQLRHPRRPIQCQNELLPVDRPSKTHMNRVMTATANRDRRSDVVVVLQVPCVRGCHGLHAHRTFVRPSQSPIRDRYSYFLPCRLSAAGAETIVAAPQWTGCQSAVATSRICRPSRLAPRRSSARSAEASSSARSALCPVTATVCMSSNVAVRIANCSDAGFMRRRPQGCGRRTPARSTVWLR